MSPEMCPDSSVALSLSVLRDRSVEMFLSSPVRPFLSRTASRSPTSPVSTPASPAAPSPGTDQIFGEKL